MRLRIQIRNWNLKYKKNSDTHLYDRNVKIPSEYAYNQGSVLYGNLKYSTLFYVWKSEAVCIRCSMINEHLNILKVMVGAYVQVQALKINIHIFWLLRNKSNIVNIIYCWYEAIGRNKNDKLLTKKILFIYYTDNRKSLLS